MNRTIFIFISINATLALMALSAHAQEFKAVPPKLPVKALAFEKDGLSYSAEAATHVQAAQKRCDIFTTTWIDSRGGYGEDYGYWSSGFKSVDQACENISDYYIYHASFRTISNVRYVGLGKYLKHSLTDVLPSQTACVRQQYKAIEESLATPENMKFVRDVLNKRKILVQLDDNSDGKVPDASVVVGPDASADDVLKVKVLINSHGACVLVPAEGEQGLNQAFLTWGAARALKTGRVLGNASVDGDKTDSKTSVVDGKICIDRKLLVPKTNPIE